MEIKPNQKNLRICQSCGATHAINGDKSGFWHSLSFPEIKEYALCEWCDPKSKRYNTKTGEYRRSLNN